MTRRKRTEKTKVTAQSETGQAAELFSPVLRALILIFLFVAAFYIRAYHIYEPPLSFHPGRQYQCAIIARSMYLEASDSAPQWRRDIARISRERVPKRELPIIEYIASIAYRIAGAEHLWIPRLTSSIFWLIGGIFLYLLIKQITSADAAIFSTAFYLFLPYGIIASRSFQPNPLMIMLLIISLWSILRYHRQPTKRKLLIAILVSALALFVYPVSLFSVFAVFGFISVYKYGIRKTIFDSRFWLFAVVSVMPSVIYFGYALFIGGFIKSFTRAAFVPELLMKSSFWRGWLYQIEKVFALPTLIAAVVGMFMFRKESKAMILGLFLSYIVYSLMFTYHIHTHDYYQLPFVVTIAISLSAIADVVTNRLSQTCSRWYWRLSVICVLIFSVFLSIYKVQPELSYPYYKYRIALAKEIGEAVGHSSKTIFLAYDYGKPLRYHGELSGYGWPTAGDFRVYRLTGKPELSAEQRFKTKYLKHSPEYFIVTDLRSFKQQPDLQKFLTGNFPLMVKNQNYLIFNLKQKLIF